MGRDFKSTPTVNGTALSTATDLTNHLNDTVDAHDASAISNVVAGDITTTDVQAAINELDARRRSMLYLPTGAKAANFPRTQIASGAVATLISGRMSVHAMDIPKGQVISSITFFSGSVAVATPTNQWFALYDSSFALLRVTSDATTAAWAATDFKTLSLSSSYTTTYSGLHYVGIMVAATTVPQLTGFAGGSTVYGVAPVLSGRASATGLTTPASAPNPADAATVIGGTPYIYVS